MVKRGQLHDYILTIGHLGPEHLGGPKKVDLSEAQAKFGLQEVDQVDTWLPCWHGFWVLIWGVCYARALSYRLTSPAAKLEALCCQDTWRSPSDP